ncbi:hypothetical protein BST61_g96 [Cercospora zeina]
MSFTREAQPCSLFNPAFNVGGAGLGIEKGRHLDLSWCLGVCSLICTTTPTTARSINLNHQYGLTRPCTLTAVGVTSLGIQLCEGLLKYYDKWRCYDKDIESTCRQIAGLVKILARLRQPLDNISQSGSNSNYVEEALEDCYESLRELQDLVIKLKPYNVPTGRSERAWAQYRRATYPLKASTLANRESSTRIFETVQLALQVEDIELTSLSQEKLSEIQLSVGGIDSTLNQVSLQTTDTANGVRQLDAAINQLSLQSTSTVNDMRHLDASVKQVLITTDNVADGVKALLHPEDQRKLNKILTWLTPVSSLDPWLDFKAARDRHQPGTGSWLLTSDSYQSWKRAKHSHLWLYGKAGCGKSILCSTAIDDLRTDYEHAPAVGFATFFFSFANQNKQSVDDMLFALIAQLARKPPGLAVLTAAETP